MLRPILVVVFALAVQTKGFCASFEKSVKPFVEKHCTDCHGAEVQKAKLRLDNLSFDLANKDAAEIWVKALDKIVSGEMPPANQERPGKAELTEATGFLTRELHQASLADQQRNGRVVLRRLNRNEFENTLSDLFGMDVDIKEMLPDDNIVGGFDNVSEGLDISSAHLLRYQDAADKVLAQAVPLRVKVTQTERKSSAKQVEANSGLKKIIGQSCKMDGEALISYVFLPRYQTLNTPGAPSTGRYKVRFSARSVNTGGKTLPIVFHYFAPNTRDDGEVRACIDVPEKMSVLEFETDLKFNDKLVINGWQLPREQEFKSRHKDGIANVNVTDPGLAIEWVEIEGPLDTAVPDSYKRIFGDVPLKARSVVNAEKQKAKPPTIKNDRNEYAWINDPLVPVSADPKKDVQRLLEDFVPRAARRPVPPERINYFVQFAHNRLDKGYTFQDAMFSAYKAVLCSTDFLLLSEKVGKLDDYALASRLSYFIWRSMPDAALLDLAAKGTLSQPQNLNAQVERMLADPKSERLVDDFIGQWLEMRKINATSPDPQLYGEFDQYLLWSMPRETRLFFTEILKNDLSVLQFIHSDWTYLNERLAQHYGVKTPTIAGSSLVKTTLAPGLHRGGVLTQGSVLKVTADGTRTSPIIRGKWVLEHIVGKPPSPPPPDVPSIEPDIRGATTIRQQLEKHRNTKACATCHKIIDPPGFALETFDVIGGWREFYRASKGGKKVPLENYPNRTASRGLDVEKGDTTPDGRAFKDIDEYKQILLDDKDQIARNIIQKLLIFSTGGNLEFADREVVEQILNKVKAKNYGLRSIIHEVVASRVFLNK